MSEKMYIPDLGISLEHFVDLVLDRFCDYQSQVESDFCRNENDDRPYFRGKLMALCTSREILINVLEDMNLSFQEEKDEKD